jgi:hypothetical protein
MASTRAAQQQTNVNVVQDFFQRLAVIFKMDAYDVKGSVIIPVVNCFTSPGDVRFQSSFGQASPFPGTDLTQS